MRDGNQFSPVTRYERGPFRDILAPGVHRSTTRTRPHLYFLDHLLAEGADLGGAGDGHVLRALVLAGDAVEGRGVVLHVMIQVRLANTGREHR